MVAGELTDEDIISAMSKENEENEEVYEQAVEKVTKREAEKALRLLHKYFENFTSPVSEKISC